MPVSFVTPSTTAEISSPKRSRTSSIDAEVSSTVSCSSAAHSVSVSRRMLAQMRATPTGCTMKSSPDLRRWSAWCSHANTNASCTRARSISTAESAACSETIANRSLSSRRSRRVQLERRLGQLERRRRLLDPSATAVAPSTRSSARLDLRRWPCLRVGDARAGLKALLAHSANSTSSSPRPPPASARDSLDARSLRFGSAGSRRRSLAERIERSARGAAPAAAR